MPFGRITLVDPRGHAAGEVLVAPGRILLRRGAIRDVSYLAVWTEARTQAIVGELRVLQEIAPAPIGDSTPELYAILRRLAPSAAAMARGGTARRRQLKAMLAHDDPATRTA